MSETDPSSSPAIGAGDPIVDDIGVVVAVDPSRCDGATIDVLRAEGFIGFVVNVGGGSSGGGNDDDVWA